VIAFSVAVAMAYLFVCLQVWVLRQYVNAMYEEQRVRAKMFAKELREIGERLSAVEGEATDVDDETEGLECESIHPAIQQRVSDALTARGFKQNGGGE
jgi:hypothetical protein